jgi:hypothetical protein
MIVRKTLHDDLHPLLCNMIINGELDPGYRVSEKILRAPSVFRVRRYASVQDALCEGAW